MDQDQQIDDVANLLAGGHSDALAGMIYPLMERMARNHRTSGKGSKEAWLKALKALGETCLIVERMER